MLKNTIENLYLKFRQHPVVCTDTRKITAGCIFFALKGANFNGNSFALQALEQGAAFAVVDEEIDITNDKLLHVNNVLETLQQLAKYHRQQFYIPVIAIVGSNGKTTTKELLTSVLQTKYNVLSTPGNFNNHIGLPLTLLMLEPKHEVAVIEMGANHIGENELLCNIALPTLGIITNNGKDHLEGFGDIEGVAKSNSELYYYLMHHNGTAFVNANDEWLMRMASRLKNKFTYAANDEHKNQDADFIGTAIQLQPTIKFNFENDVFTSFLSGDYNFDNIMSAVAIGKYLGLSINNLKTGIGNYEPKNLRSQVINTAKNKVYLDAYNANPSSMEVSIKNFGRMPDSNKVLILGDMFELGKFEEQEHQNIANYCNKFKFNSTILVGSSFYKTTNNHLKFKSTQDLISYLKDNSIKDSYIFIKGSRGMKLENIVDYL